jgi:hypothetical protein
MFININTSTDFHTIFNFKIIKNNFNFILKLYEQISIQNNYINLN